MNDPPKREMPDNQLGDSEIANAETIPGSPQELKVQPTLADESQLDASLDAIKHQLWAEVAELGQASSSKPPAVDSNQAKPMETAMPAKSPENEESLEAKMLKPSVEAEKAVQPPAEVATAVAEEVQAAKTAEVAAKTAEVAEEVQVVKTPDLELVAKNGEKGVSQTEVLAAKVQDAKAEKAGVEMKVHAAAPQEPAVPEAGKPLLAESAEAPPNPSAGEQDVILMLQRQLEDMKKQLAGQRPTAEVPVLPPAAAEEATLLYGAGQEGEGADNLSAADLQAAGIDVEGIGGAPADAAAPDAAAPDGKAPEGQKICSTTHRQDYMKLKRAMENPSAAKEFPHMHRLFSGTKEASWL